MLVIFFDYHFVNFTWHMAGDLGRLLCYKQAVLICKIKGKSNFHSSSLQWICLTLTYHSSQVSKFPFNVCFTFLKDDLKHTDTVKKSISFISCAMPFGAGTKSPNNVACLYLSSIVCINWINKEIHPSRVYAFFP